jgi:hypothetical protein
MNKHYLTEICTGTNNGKMNIFLTFIFSPNFSVLRWAEVKVIVMGLGNYHHHHAIIDFLDIIHHLVFLFKTFWKMDSCVCPQVHSLLSWAKSVKLVPISGHQHQNKAGYINQAQHKLTKHNINYLQELATYEAMHLWPCIM